MCLDSLRTRGNRLSSKRRTWDREARMKDGVVSACGCCVQNIRKQRRAKCADIFPVMRMGIICNF